MALLTAIIIAATPPTIVPAEFESWQDSWTARAVHGMSEELMNEWRDMYGQEVAPPESEPVAQVRIVQVPPPWSPSPNVEMWRGLVAAYFLPEDVETALRVIACESRGDPSVPNQQGSSALGLWQFVRSTWNWVADQTGSPRYDDGGPLDPVWSTINAAWLWYSEDKGGGPWHWACW